ncbi:hypothetical protein CLOM_g14493 [Closterium sp. NIES-68]|nr:hypothetical protein CLOM_g14493 [Closterium sp. NIES-68]GJP84364.1 hypothetical protein CLOP_g14424 [Closterium sp. NIES-67]
MPLASLVSATHVVHGVGASLRCSSCPASFASSAKRTLLHRPESFSFAASSGILRPIRSPHNPPSLLTPRIIAGNAAAGGGGGAGSGGGRKGKRRPGQKGGSQQQQERGSTENQSTSTSDPASESENKGLPDGTSASGGESGAASAAKRRKPKGAAKGPAARRWSFEQLMAVWDSQFQRVSECDGAGAGGNDKPTVRDIVRVAAAGQQQFGRGCVLVQIHVRAKLRGSAAGFGAGPGAAGMGKRGAGKGKGGAKGKGNGGKKGEGEWDEPTAEVLEASVEYVPRGMLLLEDDGRWGITEETGNEADLWDMNKGNAASAAGEKGEAGTAGAAGEVGQERGRETGEKEEEVPVVSRADLTGMVRCAGDCSRLLQLTAPTSTGSSSSSNGGSSRQDDVFDAELVEGGRKTDEKGGDAGRYQGPGEEENAGSRADWGGEAPYDERRGEFVLVLWLHMDGQAVAGADVVRVCSLADSERRFSLVDLAGPARGDEVKLVVRDLEGVEEEEEELEIV